ALPTWPPGAGRGVRRRRAHRPRRAGTLPGRAEAGRAARRQRRHPRVGDPAGRGPPRPRRRAGPRRRRARRAARRVHRLAARHARHPLDDMEGRHMTVYFIGAGPGAADLITVRGLRTLESAPVCLYAGSLVPRELLDACPPGARLVDTANLTLDEIVAELTAAPREGPARARPPPGGPA